MSGRADAELKLEERKMAVYCEKCGAKLNEKDAFCGMCGAPAEKDDVVKKDRFVPQGSGNGAKNYKMIGIAAPLSRHCLLSALLSKESAVHKRTAEKRSLRIKRLPRKKMTCSNI